MLNPVAMWKIAPSAEFQRELSDRLFVVVRPEFSAFCRAKDKGIPLGLDLDSLKLHFRIVVVCSFCASDTGQVPF
jgi:hypothetical protein